MHKSIGYHTRLDGQASTKIVGGSFGGEINQNTVEDLVNSHFDVKIKNSGRAVFVDKQNREVSLYLTVDPNETAKGKAALKAWVEGNEKQEKERQEKEDRHSLEIKNLMDGLTHEEIVQRLKIT